MLTRKGPMEQPPGLEVPIPAEPPAILVLEDQGEIQSLVTAMLRIRGFSCDLAASLAEARTLMGRRHYDILFLDMNLPDGFGLSLMEEERADAPLAIVMTGRSDIQTAIRAIRDGAIDFITKPFSVGHFLQRFDKAMEEWKARRSVQYYSQALETLVQRTTEELTRTSRQIDEVRDMTVLALGAALNLKDHETADHCSRVSRNSVALGSLLGLSEFELKNLKWSAYLHDVGKIGIPEHILLKAGDLEPEERRTVEKHPLMGYNMVRNIEFLTYATDVVLAHHERFDGSGYPRGLSGSRIPLHARIFAVVDTMDAMTSDRPYRGALPLSTVRTELTRCAGTQFDPEIVRIFLTAPAATWLVQGSAETQT
ncbi:MAG TPA: HD domain-containing phosphohydrolase [Spirochaetia bacterium]|nr:HD domain-containing phosphohydrolase [Spirochaetia bacterium]